jgi:hypothetical protein
VPLKICQSSANACIQFGQERPFVAYSGSKVYNPWVARGHVATPCSRLLGKDASATRLHFTALSASIRAGAPTSVPWGNCIGAMDVDTVYGRSLKAPQPPCLPFVRKPRLPSRGFFICPDRPNGAEG